MLGNIPGTGTGSRRAHGSCGEVRSAVLSAAFTAVFQAVLTTVRTAVFSTVLSAVLLATVMAAPVSAKPSASSAEVVAKARAFQASLSGEQKAVLERPYTSALARRWSNLPLGSAPRNGVRFADLAPAQLALAMDLIAAVSGAAAGQGYDEFVRTLSADSVLGLARPTGYGKGLYAIAFLNAPSATGAWMLQFGGHHYAANISYRNGAVIGATPAFRGIEPIAFAPSGDAAVTVLKAEKNAFADLIASLSEDEKAQAKIAPVGDLTAGAGKDGAFPAARAGIKLSGLDAARQAKALAVMGLYLDDLDSGTAAAYRALYRSELADTYFAWSGTGTFATANDYARLDGPGAWFEFLSPPGVFPGNQVHYHSIWRDKARDYGKDLRGDPLPMGAKPRERP